MYSENKALLAKWMYITGCLTGVMIGLDGGQLRWPYVLAALVITLIGAAVGILLMTGQD